ncbi:hypothetical protein M422DRAFT_132574, partial [Sphaerobolus stellatus SS14]
KFAFLWFEIQLVSSESLEDSFDVVNVHTNNALHAEILKYDIYHSLKGCWAIVMAKKHDQRFKEPPIGPESSYPLIKPMFLDIIVT